MVLGNTQAGKEVAVVPPAKQVLRPLGLAPASLEFGRMAEDGPLYPQSSDVGLF